MWLSHLLNNAFFQGEAPKWAVSGVNSSSITASQSLIPTGSKGWWYSRTEPSNLFKGGSRLSTALSLTLLRSNCLSH